VRGVRGVLAAALAAGSAAALAGLSQVSWTPEPGPEAMVRLSWRARGERVEVCRDLSAEELAQLPQHMRRERICEGTTAEYRLRVGVDGDRLVDERVQGSGEVQTRPLFVYRELVLAPGEHRLEVELERVGTTEAEDDDSAGEEDGDAPARGGESAVPRRLAFERTIRLRPREIVLVTYDAERQALVLKARPPT
jgi:hypothetical protein